MESYREFAYVYDELMDNLDYDKWINYIVTLIEQNGIQGKDIVELGCGSGTVTKGLADKGFNLIGVDLSPDMLSIAMNKNYHENIVYVYQDMRELDLGEKKDVFVSVGDSINYILDLDDLVKVFEGVKKHLKDDGIFIFDLKTEYLYESIGDSVIADNRDDIAMIWENNFEDGINEYLVTIFAEREDGAFDRFQELHKQRAYSIEEIKSALKKVGFDCEVYDAFTLEPPKNTSERYYFVAKK